jgi:hypothetical protein
VDDSERKDNARTYSHENSCGQDALPTLCHYSKLAFSKRLTLQTGMPALT